MIIILDRRDAMTRDLSTIELILEWAKEAMQPTERAMTQCFFKGWDSKHIFLVLKNVRAFGAKQLKSLKRFCMF